jgi:hypothetical protein
VVVLVARLSAPGSSRGPGARPDSEVGLTCKVFSVEATIPQCARTGGLRPSHARGDLSLPARRSRAVFS